MLLYCSSSKYPLRCNKSIQYNDSRASFKAMKLLLLKSALLIALHASALTSLTSVTTRENRSELHSPLTAPEVVLLRYSCHFLATGYRELQQIANEVGWKKADVRWKMSFVLAYVVSIPSYNSHAPSQPGSEDNHST